MLLEATQLFSAHDIGYIVFSLSTTVASAVGVYISLQNRVTRTESKQDAYNAQLTEIRGQILQSAISSKSLETIINTLNVAVAKLLVTVESLQRSMDINLHTQTLIQNSPIKPII